MGTPVFMARSMILQIFRAYASESEPPNTVKSWAKTNTGRPCMRPGAHDHPVAGDALGIHPEVMPLVHHQLVHLGERALVEEELEALAGGLLSGLVLALDALRAPAQVGGLVAAA